jgi:putative ABC transport system ATP-binding protein
MTNPAIQLAHASKYYQAGNTRFDALLPLDLSISEGEFIGLVGPSGSGKSTLLNLVAGIDRPSAGKVSVAGSDITMMAESALAAFRGRHIGIVFQFFQLIPTLSVLENVVLAMDLVGAIPSADRRQRALSLLEDVGVESHAHKLPSELSGGEQQRVAIARALANDPPILVADEPTGNLDSANSRIIEGIFSDCARKGRTVVLATHETGRLDQFGRVLRLADGALVADEFMHGDIQGKAS